MKKNSEIREKWEDWQSDRNQQTLSELLSTANPVINKAITSFAGQPDPVVNLEAKKLAVKAFENYDPAKGASLQTYLMNSLRPLTRKTHQRAQELKISPKVYWDFKNMQREIENYREQYRMDPSIQELSELTGLSTKRIEKLKEFDKANIPLSVLREADPEEFFKPGIEEEESFWGEAVYQSLDPTDQKIWDMRLGRIGEGPASLQQISRELGISKSAISQRISKIVQQLERGAKYE